MASAISRNLAARRRFIEVAPGFVRDLIERHRVEAATTKVRARATGQTGSAFHRNAARNAATGNRSQIAANTPARSNGPRRGASNLRK